MKRKKIRKLLAPLHKDLMDLERAGVKRPFTLGRRFNYDSFFNLTIKQYRKYFETVHGRELFMPTEHEKEEKA